MTHTVTGRGLPDPDEPGRGLSLRFIRGQDTPAPASPRTRGPRRPGSVLITAAAALLFLLGAGLLAVSLAAQYRYVLAVKHQVTAAVIEALALDFGMAVFSLLALGLARAGQPARAERALIMTCAAGSAVMNYAAADALSPRSVLAYVMPPVFLAVVADRVIAVMRRHVLTGRESSPWVPAGRAGCYLVRLVLAPASTARGLRRWLLASTPLPEAATGPSSPRGAGTGRSDPAGPRAGSKTARFLALAASRHGPLASIDIGRVSKIAAALAPEAGLDPGAARTALRRAVVAARDAAALDGDAR